MIFVMDALWVGGRGEEPQALRHEVLTGEQQRLERAVEEILATLIGDLPRSSLPGASHGPAARIGRAGTRLVSS